MKLILFCGPSGSGKTSMVHHLLKTDNRFTFSISATTRPIRENEVNGVDYYFLSPEEFKNKIANDEFIEWEQVYEGRYYGTLKEEIERIYKMKKTALFDVDVEGGLKIKRVYEDNVLAVFVKPPSLDALRERLVKRSTETTESLESRIEKAAQELMYADRFDFILVNDNFKKACEDAVELINDFLK